MLNRLSVSAKFIILIFLLTVGVAACLSYYAIVKEYERRYQLLQQNLQERVLKHSPKLQYSTYFADRAVLTGIVQDFQSLAAVAYAAVYNHRSKPLQKSDGFPLEQDAAPAWAISRGGADLVDTSVFRYQAQHSGHEIEERIIPLFSPVSPLEASLTKTRFLELMYSAEGASSQHVMSYLRVGIDITELERSMTSFMLYVLLYAGLFIVISLLCALVFTRWITAPLSRLASIAQDVSLGKLDHKFKVKGGGDEVKEIAHMLNLIVRSLSSYKTKIDVDHQLLSMKVDERTTQLIESNKQLKQAVDEANEAKDRLRHLAYYDSLTVLPNRQFFTEQLGLLLRVAKREDYRLALLFIDLDNFKRINDSLGHTAGDVLLKEVAGRLKDCIRESDLISRYIDDDFEIGVSRLGGDEFTVVLNRIDDDATAGRIAQRLLDALAEPLILEGHELVITPSIGIAIAPEDSDNVEDLLKHADTAMYHAKSAGKNNYTFYASQMNEKGMQRLKLETELRRALEQDELVLHYQPQINIQTGKIIGAEAMVRWQHPEHGLIPPLHFIPLAEEMGLIVDLGEWVLTEACRQMQYWRSKNIKLPKMAVNVSSLQFNHAWFLERIKQAISDTGIHPTSLELELTESVIMNNADSTIEALNELKELGVTLSVDDFGTGYSSLNYLSRFPLDELKIDQSFIVDIDKDKHNAGLVIAIIAMAKSLNLRLVAEGVETEEQYHFLREQGIEVIQGYLFSQALPPKAFEDLINSDPFYARILSFTPATNIASVISAAG